MQGQWLLYGGCWTGEAYHTFHVFNFDKLAWSAPKLGGATPQARYYHMAASHNQAMVVLGGQQHHLLPDQRTFSVPLKSVCASHSVLPTQTSMNQPLPHMCV